MSRTKEEAKKAYAEIILHSWTFGRMTEAEKVRCMKILDREPIGNFGQRCKEYAERYNAFLLGLGYTGPFWRDTETNDAPAF